MKKLGMFLLFMCLISTGGVSSYAQDTLIVGKEKEGVIQVKKPKLSSGELAFVRIQKGNHSYSFPLRKNESIPNPFGNGDVQVLIAISKNATFRTHTLQYVKLQSTETVRTQQPTILSPGTSAYGVKTMLKSNFKGWERWNSETKVKKVHQYVSKTFSYDYVRSGNQGAWYIPDYTRFMKNKKGTCYDIASLTSSLLREMEVPTRLTMGYPKGNTYHAWNEVYINKEWKVMDVTYDLQQNVSNLYKKTSDYQVKYRF